MCLYRDKNCSELRIGDVGSVVKLSGWVHRIRDHGGLLFIDLRDHYGITQIVFEEGSKAFKTVSKVRNESVILVSGNVVKRSDDSVNRSIPTGEIELYADFVSIHSLSDVVPFEVNSDRYISDDLRLKYRFLDLRRSEMHARISARSQIIQYIRNVMHNKGFTEVSTPVLTASSPEGARDYLVPSRLHKGLFYALPQAPQQFKQLLMMSGFDKYFQIAPCFRDEDARADRAPGEFYQLDMEMSFVTEEDVMNISEDIISDVFIKFGKYKMGAMPFPKIAYAAAKSLYGTDKPDLRNPLKSYDVSDIFLRSDFQVFKRNVAQGLKVRAVSVPRCGSMPRSFFDKKIEAVKTIGGSGMAYLTFDRDSNAKGPIAKFLSDDLIAEMRSILSFDDNHAILFSCEFGDMSDRIIAFLIQSLGEELGLIDNDIYEFCWITDFPFYEYDHDLKTIDFGHNPFSMPKGGIKTLEDAEDPLTIVGEQYDLVCNGVELSSGAIRNHDLNTLYKAFSIVGYDKESVDSHFPAIISGLRYGAPPHGGFAPGIDRMLMLLLDTDNIRDVICFPMNQRSQDTMMGAPSSVDSNYLKILGITAE